MSAEVNKAIALRASEIVNQKNPDLIEECYPPDFDWHGPDQDIRGYEQAKRCPPRSLQPSPTPRSPTRT
jgi:hypothetical protein